jgi:hypothetical protein
MIVQMAQRIERWLIDKLIRFAHNPRTHSSSIVDICGVWATQASAKNNQDSHLILCPPFGCTAGCWHVGRTAESAALQGRTISGVRLC